jgi:DNA uptake protein ComE-like DNA-binding protein
MSSMLNPVPQSQTTPTWVWLSFIPLFGALAIVSAGHKSKTPNWIYLGLGVSVTALITLSTSYAVLVWLFQIAASFYIKTAFLSKTRPQIHTVGLNNLSENQFLPTNTESIDINSCSKDELVRCLGLPIVYANDIKSLQDEGFLFTHLEELSEIAGLPESYLKQLEKRLIFLYDSRKDIDASWRRVNVCSVEDLTALGIKIEVANKIIQERDTKGEYRSVMDIKRRTNTPFKAFCKIV